MSRREAFVDVAAVSDLPPGELLGVTLPGGVPVCLFNDAGVVGAVGGQCSHAEFPLSDGMLRPDGTIECVWHGARFDCRTGAARRLPATDPVPVFTVRVEQGRILVGPPAASVEERSA